MNGRNSRALLPAALLVGLFAAAGVDAAETGRHQRVGDVDIYYGILPAQIVGRHDPAHPERSMHGGVPAARGSAHLIVALFDREGRRITSAEVEATVAEIGMAPKRRRLEPMQIEGTTTFGNYFDMTGEGPYRITVHVLQPGSPRTLEAQFEYRR